MRARLIITNVKSAVKTLRQAKWRSLLTICGIVVGIVWVVTMISLGEGVKRRVEAQIQGVGTNIVTVSSGKLVSRDKDRVASALNLFASIGVSTLTSGDVEQIAKVPSVSTAVPLNIISGVATAEDIVYENGTIIAATDGLSQIVGERVQYGNFFGPSDNNKNVAIIGKYVAEELFGANIPTGRLFTIRDEEFVVRGVFEEFETSPLVMQPDFNRAIVIPYGSGTRLSDGAANIYQILVQADSDTTTAGVAEEVQQTLLAAHDNQEDFTVLTQKDKLALVSDLLDAVTSVIGAIAAVSLIIGGIGIMNIMLVSVTERTQEIGLRKAVGASNRQIGSQFLVESVVLGVAGGVIGVVLAMMLNFLLRILTSLQPVITWPVIAIALALATLVGAFFGVMPALRAAKKHPIESLRQQQ